MQHRCILKRTRSRNHLSDLSDFRCNENGNIWEKESDEVEVSLKLPGLLADELRQSSSSGRSFGRSYEFDWASECTEVDNGWMYRGVGAYDTMVQDFFHLVRGTVDPAKDHEQLQRLPQRQHFVWPSDSF